MAYTASALSFMLENLTKPIILTGSQLPIGLLRTDGKENILTSIEIASTYNSDNRPMVPEVCIYFSGRLLRGNRSTKQNADGFNAFDSFNYPHLCDAGVNFNFHEHHILQPDYSQPVTPHTAIDSNVVVFSLFPGIQENIVRHVLQTPELRGIIMRSYGSGNAPQHPWLVHLLKGFILHSLFIFSLLFTQSSIGLGKTTVPSFIVKPSIHSGIIRSDIVVISSSQLSPIIVRV